MGALLEARGLRVTFLKLDPYLNVDPGTMNPFQHGEVYVTEDGAETDLDLGHYERFTTSTMGRVNNVTAGKIYDTVLSRERRGDYLGAARCKSSRTSPTRSRSACARGEPRASDVIFVEIGGTVGDIESLPFLEAIRQLRAAGRPRQRVLRARGARALRRDGRRAQDEARPALGQGAAVASASRPTSSCVGPIASCRSR